MNKGLFFLLFALISSGLFAQEEQFEKARQNQYQNDQDQLDQEDQGDQQQTVIDKRERPPVENYKIISVDEDTTHIDTTLSVQGFQKFNYLRKDNFGLLKFPNVGQTYNKLTYSFDEVRVKPKFAAQAAHYPFMDVEDIHYYRVPTPWTNLLYKSTFEQGQIMDAFFTSNLNPRLNLSIAYKGLRSIGKYQHVKTSQGSFRATLNYQTKNGRYAVKTHFISQNLSVQENGGLDDRANQQFASKSDQYSDRSTLDPKFEDGESYLRPKRFYVKHYFKLIPGIDSTTNNEVRVGHVFNFTDQEYRYTQGSSYPDFGLAYQNSDIKDLTKFQDISNTFFVQYQNKLLGKLSFRFRHSNYNYGYKRRLNLDEGVVPNRLKGNIYGIGASYEKTIGGFDFTADAMLNPVGDFDGNYLKAKASYEIDSLNKVEASALTNSRRPNYNFLLYQSAYKNYNWRNDYSNEQKQQLGIKLDSKNYANLEARYTRLHNHPYFGLRDNENRDIEADTLVIPRQYDADISYFKIKAGREFHFGHFSLDNTVLYQDVLDGKSALHVPSFITRNTLYYQNYLFHENLFFQTGFTLNYFSSYKADGYDPVLSEFYVQDQKLEGFPRLDFFFNAKVSQARIFLNLENFTTIFRGNGHYAAPRHPYRDFSIRFGMIWNFFL